MSVELRPLGVKCNIQCLYCYQHPQRDAGNVAQRYDLAAMMAAVERAGGGFTLFGGEALLVPLPDLERLWAWGLERFGHNGVQTNGTLITDAHIALFKRYRVHVGISIDGPGELNDARWVGTAERTRAATARTEAAIARLCDEGIAPSLIVTLHRGNATPQRLPRMHAWMRELEAMGVTAARLHTLEVDHPGVREAYMMSTEENVAALRSFARLEATALTKLRFDVFEDMRRLLRGEDDSTTCVWNACDPYTTRAVQGVEGQGQRSNCGRTNKDGIDFVKSDREGFERYLALYHTPQEVGGCQGCRFFLMCKGECPGTAIDGDWRNRSEHCGVWKSLFRDLEGEMLDAGVLPVSARPDRRAVESVMLGALAAGRTLTIAGALRQIAPPPAVPAHGDAPHGDAPHGDHTDRPNPATARQAATPSVSAAR